MKRTDVAKKTNLSCKYLYDNLLFSVFFIFLQFLVFFFLSSPQRLRVLLSVLTVLQYPLVCRHALIPNTPRLSPVSQVRGFDTVP